MSPRLRKVPTASGATAVEIVTKRHGKLTVIEHLGSAHAPAQLATFEEAGPQKINDATGQLSLDLDSGNNVSTTSRRRVKGSAARLLIDTIRTAYNRLGFDAVDDEAFFQLDILGLHCTGQYVTDSETVLLCTPTTDDGMSHIGDVYETTAYRPVDNEASTRVSMCHVTCRQSCLRHNEVKLRSSVGGVMVLPALDEQTGLLPLGRFGASLEDIKRQYVDGSRYSTSRTRAEIWQHFESATEGIRSILPVVCVWIGGSFLTGKVDPDDIDLVYWCEDVLIEQVTDPREAFILQLFATNQLRERTGLRVDTRYCPWHVFPEADRAQSVEHLSYVQRRGYWDDFWMRKRSGAKDAPPQRDDALPRRGYFEVPLDGFHDV